MCKKKKEQSLKNTSGFKLRGSLSCSLRCGGNFANSGWFEGSSPVINTKFYVKVLLAYSGTIKLGLVTNY